MAQTPLLPLRWLALIHDCGSVIPLHSARTVELVHADAKVPDVSGDEGSGVQPPLSEGAVRLLSE